MKWTLDKVTSEARKYSSRLEFQIAAPGAYAAAKRNKWLDKVCYHMPKRQRERGYWTKDKVQKLLDKCSTRVEFQKKYHAAYRAAQRHGWLDSLMESIPMQIKPRGYWTKDRLKKIAENFTDRSKFAEEHPGLYAITYREGWVEEIFSHMIRKTKKFSDEEIHLIASQCKNVAEFRKKHNQAYRQANRRGLLEVIYTKYKLKRAYRDRISKENCKEAAKKCKSRTEFQKTYKSEWASARRNGWLDEICSHMERKGNKFQKHIYCIFFDDETAYVGLTYDLRARYLNHLRKSSFKDKFNRFNWHAVILHRNINFRDALVYEQIYINYLMDSDWYCLNTMPGGSLGGTHFKWTEEKLFVEAKKYQTRTEFNRKSSGAYSAAWKLGLLDKVCKHMDRRKDFLDMIRHNKSKCMEVAKEYKNLTELQRADYSLWKVVKDNGWEEEFFPNKKSWNRR